MEIGVGNKYGFKVCFQRIQPDNVWEGWVVLFNRNYRRYYATRTGDFGITLDTRLEFYKVNSTFGSPFTHHQRDPRSVVVELKYEVEQEPQASRVAGFFPFRMTRSSKYVQGIERVYF